MTSDLEKDIFFDALGVHGEERAQLLEERCTDEAMRARVVELLRAHEDADAFMADPTLQADGVQTPTNLSDDVEGVPGPIGAYHPLSLLGEGGFGRVYLAEQFDPIRRRVALKVLKAGMDTRAIVARFEAERQTLALMDHPNVARVIDGGQTESGHPFFVMEYIKGEPLTTFCRKNNLSIRRRLELFEQVCLAVQHAHQKGIIHRDLKPSNVLVTMVDEKPVPKVIDFGIAKAIIADHRDTRVTAEGHLVGTPAYMSPEQVRGELGVDTRSDVYTLGVILYELLTGEQPFDSSRIESASPAVLEAIICEETPPKPSTRVIKLRATTLPDSRTLSNQLRGDLDWIIMRCLEKEPTRRYQMVGSLAADVRRYLRDEAVEAGPPSGFYRVKKFAKRHRGEFAATALILVALIAGLVSSLIFANRVERQRDLTQRELVKSQAFATFAKDMLSGVDPAVARGQDTALFVQILDDANASLDASPPSDPEVEAEMRDLLGTAYQKVARFDEAERQFLRAIKLSAGDAGLNRELQLLEATYRSDLAKVYAETTRFDEAQGALEEVLSTRSDLLGPDHPDTIETRFDLGAVDRRAGRYQEARETFEAVLEDQIRVLGNAHEDTMSTRNSLATVLNDLGELDRSVELLRIVVNHQLEHLGEDHPHTLATRNNLAGTLSTLGQNEESLQILEEVLEIKKRILGPDHPSLILAMNNLASGYGDIGRNEEALRMLREAHAICERTLGERDMKTLILVNNISKQLMTLGRVEEARKLLMPALPIATETLGESHPLIGAMLTIKVGIHRESGEPEQAVETCEQLIETASATLPPDHPARARHQRLLAECHLDAGNPSGARALLEQTLESQRASGESAAELVKTLTALMTAYEALELTSEAERVRAELAETETE